MEYFKFSFGLTNKLPSAGADKVSDSLEVHFKFYHFVHLSVYHCTNSSRNCTKIENKLTKNSN